MKMNNSINSNNDRIQIIIGLYLVEREDIILSVFIICLTFQIEESKLIYYLYDDSIGI